MLAFKLAAPLAALFFGSMASAAPVQNIDIRLSFQGNSYFDTTVVNDMGEILYQDEVLTQQNDVWGLPRLFNFAIGEVLRLTATIDPELESGVTSCNLGGFDCTTNALLDDAPTDPLSIFYNLEEGLLGWLRGGLTPGSNLVFDLANPLQGFLTAETRSGDQAIWFASRSEFDVIRDLPQPAPIPLPASILFLPVGLGGMALLRRRQKHRAA